MPGPVRDIIVIGASAGGMEALRSLAAGLPENLNATIFVVIHLAPEHRSFLPEIPTAAGPLPAGHTADGEPIRRGNIYVAPPDHHLTIEEDHVLVHHSVRENRQRPAIDPLFRSAAMHHGAKVAGVILTGNLNDGVAGLQAVKRRGGVTIVQDPEEAQYPSLPRNAIRDVAVDHVLPLDAITSLLVQCVRVGCVQWDTFQKPVKAPHSKNASTFTAEWPTRRARGPRTAGRGTSRSRIRRQSPLRSFHELLLKMGEGRPAQE